MTRIAAGIKVFNQRHFGTDRCGNMGIVYDRGCA
jgi:hypothetical protein